MRSRRRWICGSSIATAAALQAVKTFHLDPASYIVSYRGTAKQGDRELSPAIVWGPAIGDMGVQQTYVKKSEALLFENGKVVRVAPSDIAKQPERDGDMGYVGVDDNYFLIAALQPGPSKVTFQAITIPPPPGTKTGHELVCVRDRGAPRRRADQVLRRPERLRRAERDRPRCREVDQLRQHPRADRRAAAEVAEMGERLRRQLRLVDHHPHADHQRHHVSAAAQERRVDAEDAGDPARGQSDSGALLEAESDRSRRSRR